jgi:hypothetical protein
MSYRAPVSRQTSYHPFGRDDCFLSICAMLEHTAGQPCLLGQWGSFGSGLRESGRRPCQYTNACFNLCNRRETSDRKRDTHTHTRTHTHTHTERERERERERKERERQIYREGKDRRGEEHCSYISESAKVGSWQASTTTKGYCSADRSHLDELQARCPLNPNPVVRYA